MNVSKEKTFLLLILELWHKFSKKRKTQIIFLAILSSVSAFAELVSIGMIFPFLAALTDPEILLQNYYLKSVLIFFNLEEKDFLSFITISFCIAIIASVCFRVLVYYLLTRISFSAGADICKDIMYKVISQPYKKHSEENSSEVIAGIINKSNTVIYGVIVPVLMIMSSLTVLFLFIGALLAVSIKATFSIFAITIFIYSVLVFFSNKKLQSNSEIIAKNQTLSVKTIQEALGSIRNIILDGTGNFFHKRFSDADFITRYNQGTNMFIGASPKYIVEGIGIIAIAIIAFIFVKSSYSETIIPILGLYALAAQKLLPISQIIYGSFTQISGSRESLIDVLKYLNISNESNISEENIDFKKSIKIQNVSFSYDNKKNILNNINLDIKKGDKIGIIGPTGSGKSTFIDIISGLILPLDGSVYVDEKKLTQDNLRSWQNKISYVPQDIYLIDSSIKENIALGKQEKFINSEKVNSSLEKVALKDFVSQKEYGIKSRIGEAGSQLSGGQRQRIGLARAIYKNSEILILDEATSALDSKTENSIIEEIYSLKNITLIMVTHRPRVLDKCNKIFEIKNGVISPIL